MRRNRRNAAAFVIEREQLQDLPVRRTTDFVEEEARVTRCGAFTVRAILYSAPSRLIGHRLKVRLYSDRLDCYLSGALVLTLARGARSAHNGRGRVSDYRHFIDDARFTSTANGPLSLRPYRRAHRFFGTPCPDRRYEKHNTTPPPRRRTFPVAQRRRFAAPIPPNAALRGSECIGGSDFSRG